MFRTLCTVIGFMAVVAGCSAEAGMDTLDPASEAQGEAEDVAVATPALTADWSCSTTSLGGGRWSRFCAQGTTGCVAIYTGGQWGAWDCNN